MRPLVKSYPLDADKAVLTQKYVDERLSTAEIAKLLGVARSAVLKYLKVHGIPLRHASMRRVAGRGLAYGKRILNRQEVAFKREQENMAKMRELRAKGFSYGKIAEVLNTLNIPTRTRKAAWQARTVWAVLNKHKT
jgi:hypothetical protein